jgi:hypothetical protein
MGQICSACLRTVLDEASSGPAAAASMLGALTCRLDDNGAREKTTRASPTVESEVDGGGVAL